MLEAGTSCTLACHTCCSGTGFLSAFLVYSQQRRDLGFADSFKFGLAACTPRFCESVVRSCFAYGTYWLFLLCDMIVEAFSTAANQKPYLNKALCTRKSARTNCWQCITLKPSLFDWKHVLNAGTKLAKSGEYHLVNARKAHIHHNPGCFNPKAQTFPDSGNVQYGSTNSIAPAR